MKKDTAVGGWTGRCNGAMRVWALYAMYREIRRDGTGENTVTSTGRTVWVLPLPWKTQQAQDPVTTFVSLLHMHRLVKLLQVLGTIMFVVCYLTILDYLVLRESCGRMLWEL